MPPFLLLLPPNSGNNPYGETSSLCKDFSSNNWVSWLIASNTDRKLHTV